MSKLGIFGRTRELEAQIDAFCDTVDQGALAYKLGVGLFFRGEAEAFDEKLQQVNELESQGDTLRREIERKLYIETLIPESRGDVLGLLENMDRVLNACEGSMWQFSIEHPAVPVAFHGDFLALVDHAVSAVDALVSAARAFFREIESVADHSHKVMFFEKEADKVSTRLKRAVFASDLELAHKNQLRYFVEHIDNIADTAEDITDRLAIYTIKRSI